MSIQKVVERKNAKAKKAVSVSERKKEVAALFREYAISQAEELKKVFPYVVIGRDESDNILGVSYSSCRWTSGEYLMSGSTHNISMTWKDNVFHIGYGANSASFTKRIPFDLDMKKPALKKVFKQAIETLVSGAYWTHSDYYKSENKKSIVWQTGKGEV